MGVPTVTDAWLPRRDGAPPPYSSRTHADASRPTVLILTAPTGAGHDSVAAALTDALGATLPRARVLIRDPLRARAAGPSWVGWWYALVAARAPRLWGRLYHWSNTRGGVWLGAVIVTALYGRRLRATVRATRPDLVVSVHPLCARLAAHRLGGAPHHCVVTDLASIHRYWASQDIDVFYVATPEAAAALRSHGILAGRIRVTGLPLRRAFAVPPGASPAGDAIPHAVMLDGGRATRASERAARALLAFGGPLRLTIVCGSNDGLRRRLEAATSGRATVLGWCDDVAELMRAASVVVTKAGSATLAEAWSQARPALVYRVLPGQEEGNVALLAHEGRGQYVPVVDDLPAAMWRVHAGGPAMREAAWWGQAADRVAAQVASALWTPARAAPDDQGPPHATPPLRAARGYPVTIGMGHADGARPQSLRASADRGDARRRARDTRPIEEGSPR